MTEELFNYIKQHVIIYPTLTSAKQDLPGFDSALSYDLKPDEDLYSRIIDCAQTVKLNQEHFGNTDNASWNHSALQHYFMNHKVVIVDNQAYVMKNQVFNF